MNDLTGPERRLWEAFARGTEVDLRAAGRGPGQAIRAEVVAALLLGAREGEPGHFAALRLRGARITGCLDLRGTTLHAPLHCESCTFDEPVRLAEAITRTVRISGGRLPCLDGARLRVDGILDLHGTAVERGVCLVRATAAGEVSLRGATLGPDEHDVALAADGLAVEGDLLCDDGFAADGAVLLSDARVGGSMNFTDAAIAHPRGGSALVADRAVIDGQLLARRLRAAGTCHLRNARIGGSLHLGGAKLRAPGGIALGCGGLTIHGGIWCWEDFTAEGELRFAGAQLRANLALNGATLDNPGGPALNLDRATLSQLDGTGLTVAAGRLSLLGTQLAERLILVGARLGGDHRGRALVADGAAFGSLRCQGMRATGEVRFRSSVISGHILLMDAELGHPGGIALRFTRNEVGSNMVCNRLVAAGQVRMVESRIGRHLSLKEVTLANPGGTALDVHMLQAAELSLEPAAPIGGTVILSHAKIGLLRDDPARWPERLRLDGLTYDSLQPPLPARRRLGWLDRDPEGHHPQPYEQLAASYARNGQQAEARRVLHAKEVHHRRTLPRPGRIWGAVQDVTVAYGYRPWRAALWLALLVVVGGVVYGLSPPEPLKADEAPHFNPVIYALDLLLPIVDLGQERAFDPAGAAQWFSYVLIAAGWILATTIAAGVARTISRR